MSHLKISLPKYLYLRKRLAKSAVRKKHPRARYRIGRGAHLMVTSHAVMPTSWWDWVNSMFLKLKIKGVTDKKSA